MWFGCNLLSIQEILGGSLAFFETGRGKLQPTLVSVPSVYSAQHLHLQGPPILNFVAGFLRDHIQVNALLIVLCFVSVLALSSQSAASYSTYRLARLQGLGQLGPAGQLRGDGLIFVSAQRTTC